MSSSQRVKSSEFANPSKIIGIQFSLLSPEEIRKNSVVEITKKDTYMNNKPVIGGLFDPRMGVLEPGLICPTDGLTYIDTPGYFGHIELARPVLFIQHLKEILKILKCVCFKCSKLLLDKSKHMHILDMPGKARCEYVFDILTKKKKIRRCGDLTGDGCGCLQPETYKLEGLATIHAFWPSKNTDNIVQQVNMKLTPEIILKIFKRISDEDSNFMGFNPTWARPEWMICQVLPVPPPATRPSVKLDAQQRSEDDLTHIYSNIIKTNNELKNKINSGAVTNAIEGLSLELQYLIAMIVNNKVKGSQPISQSRSGRPYQCIMSRLNSKHGRIRWNLMGKRVDFSARSVITGDPNLSIRQLGVPLKIAKNITKPVVVNDLNHDFLLKLVQTGPDEHPGAKILERKNGDKISLRYVDRNSLKLYPGDIVHRHMMNGDYVLFNRQPSLHRPSMMCHEVVIMKKGDTFRMNVGDTKPYNADFDGDEMNMHMPQNIMAETELRCLAAIPYQIISPANNSPIIGIYQDSLLGSYRFTRSEMDLTPRQAMNLLMMYPHVNTDKLFENGQQRVTNFDVLSQIMPPITLMYKNKLWDDSEDPAISNNIIEIRNGKYVRGQMEKSVLGSSTKGIVHRACNDFSNRASSDFIDNLQNVVTEYMKSSSFSVGISDLMSNRETTTQIVNVIRDKKKEVGSLIEKLHLGIFENNTSASNRNEFETQVNNILNNATKETDKIGHKSLNKNNRFLMIVNSGSKGTLLNISQMISCLGQVNVEGKRIPYGFDNRTLPHFSKFDDSPNARGFIENSYIGGLTATELFFHAMGGRIGLIDTAVKTSQTGYIQRCLIKGLEDLKVEYDMTIRNNKGKIIQFRYGDDGFDSVKVEYQAIPLVGMSTQDIYLHYDMIGVNNNDTGLLEIFSKSTITRFKKQRDDTKTICKKYIDMMLETRDDVVEYVFRNKNDNMISMPVSFQNIINNTQGNLNLSANSIVDITPLEAFQLIEEYYEKLVALYYAPPTKLFKTMYYFYLNPRDLLYVKRFHRKALIVLLENIVLKYKQAIVHPGEMVGVIAGQSIGEPTTQLTLNTFHLAGVASKSNVTRGVPRIQEILRLTENPKKPSLVVHLKPNEESNSEKAAIYATMMEHTRLSDVVRSVKICFDPNENNTSIDEDRGFMAQFYEFNRLMQECSAELKDIQKSKWVVRMEMDPEIMLDKNITMDDINFAIKHSLYGQDIDCVYSDYNSDKLIFRIRMLNILANKKKRLAEPLDETDEIYAIKNFQDALLNNVVLRGVNGIDNVLTRKIQNYVAKDDGKYVKKDTWVLDTTGTNLLDALALDYIDSTRTISNDIKEVFDILGIEAARQIVHDELVEVMEFSGVSINYHHVSLLCDRVTSCKDMVSIYRTGMFKDDIGPIAKSTFEVHTEILLNAAKYGEFDPMRGVSANVMCGQNGYFGTNAFQLVLDMKEMENVEDKYEEKMKSVEDMFDGLSVADDACARNKIVMHNNIENIKRIDPGMCDDDYDMGF